VVVRSLVPVSVRRRRAAGVFDNEVSALLADLPVEVKDPRRRLAEVGVRMRRLKASHMVEAGEALTAAARYAPPALLAYGTRATVRLERLLAQRTVTTVTTNVPGPPYPLFALGRRMLHYLPYVPISQGVRTGVAMLSYDGKLGFGFTGDAASTPDLAVLRDGTLAGLAELVALAGPHRPAVPTAG
jgi:diacylglycerol O-acyltransferase